MRGHFFRRHSTCCHDTGKDQNRQIVCHVPPISIPKPKVGTKKLHIVAQILRDHKYRYLSEEPRKTLSRQNLGKTLLFRPGWKTPVRKTALLDGTPTQRNFRQAADIFVMIPTGLGGGFLLNGLNPWQRPICSLGNAAKVDPVRTATLFGRTHTHFSSV